MSSASGRGRLEDGYRSRSRPTLGPLIAGRSAVAGRARVPVVDHGEVPRGGERVVVERPPERVFGHQGHRDRDVPGVAQRGEPADGLDDAPVVAPPDAEPLVGRVATVRERERLVGRRPEAVDAREDRDGGSVDLADEPRDRRPPVLVDRGGVDICVGRDRPGRGVRLAPGERRLAEAVGADAGVAAAGDRDPVRSEVERPAAPAPGGEQRRVGEEVAHGGCGVGVADGEQDAAVAVERVPQPRGDHDGRRVVRRERLHRDPVVAAGRDRGRFRARLRAGDRRTPPRRAERRPRR
ncbi:MAG: hypothetical protein U5J95_03245 [Balneolaceae bacterium]|nr:hypothetical protein [Balneolaceae bacterium]